MAELNLSNFIVDRILSGVGYASDGSVYFKMDQCQDTSITCGSEATEIVDNVGAPVMTLYRAKSCEISGQNAILDMNLTAFQMGTTKTVAKEGKVIVPAGEYEFIYAGNGDFEIFVPRDQYYAMCSAGIYAVVYSQDGLEFERVLLREMSENDNEDYAEVQVCYSHPDADLAFGCRVVITVDEDITDGNAIIAPAVEVITVPDNYQVELSHTPVSIPRLIYTLNNDGSLGRAYGVGLENSSEDYFFISGKLLYLPSDLERGDQVFISYEYKATAGIETVNSAKNFPKSCKLVLKALGYNPCEKDNKLACYIIFPSFEMSPDFDLSLQAGETQAWSGKASQDYCSKDKRLMSIVVVDEDDDMF